MRHATGGELTKRSSSKVGVNDNGRAAFRLAQRPRNRAGCEADDFHLTTDLAADDVTDARKDLIWLPTSVIGGRPVTGATRHRY